MHIKVSAYVLICMGFIVKFLNISKIRYMFI